MGRRRLALFTEVLDFDDSYSDELWKAVDSRARDLDADLVVFVGRRFDDPQHPAHQRLYDLALTQPFDALVVAHIVFQHLKDGRLAAWAQKFDQVAAATTSISLGTLPVARFDPGRGLDDLVEHLIQVHGRRRLLLVAGPPDVEDGLVRYQAWKRVCQAHGLPTGDEWVVAAEFNPLNCPGAAEEAARRVKVLGADGVVVSSDLMAEAVLQALRAEGVRVPEDVTVTGYDDVRVASRLDPALTTVRQPVADQFRLAVDLALEGRREGAAVEASLVVRQSCGCPDTSSPDDPSWRARTFEALEETRRLRARVASLNQFAGQIDVLPGVEGLGALLDTWMPRLGLETWALSASCRQDGLWSPDADWLVPISTRPPAAGTPVAARALGPAGWWLPGHRRTVAALPLATDQTWYGVLLVELGPEGNLMCRAVQELVTAFLDREHRLKQEIRRGLEAELMTQIEADKTRTLGLLVAGFSHDLATPLSVGRDSIGLLSTGLSDLAQSMAAGILSKTKFEQFLREGRTLINMVEGNWTRAIDLVDRFKRIGTEVPREEVRTIQPAGLVADLIISLQPLWRRKSVQVELEADPNLVVTTRVSALVDIVTNLLQNALVHAFPEGRPGKVVLQVVADGPDRCQLICTDNGVGIPQDLRARVFDPYVTTREGRGGTGLGLAVVRQRATEVLGGAATLEEPRGGGCRFVISFPVRLAE